MLSGTELVVLCGLAGFLIVWLATPTRPATSEKTKDDTADFASGSEDSSDRKQSKDVRPQWCDVLLLDPNATEADIRKAYARLMKGLHPDVAPPGPRTNAQCAMVQRAYEEAKCHILKSGRSRR